MIIGCKEINQIKKIGFLQTEFGFKNLASRSCAHFSAQKSSQAEFQTDRAANQHALHSQAALSR